MKAKENCNHDKDVIKSGILIYSGAKFQQMLCKECGCRFKGVQLE
jgi:hypothetical protein